MCEWPIATDDKVWSVLRLFESKMSLDRESILMLFVNEKLQYAAKEMALCGMMQKRNIVLRKV